MSVVRFPPRRSAAVWILPDEGGWLVMARGHGWLHGNCTEALKDAFWLAKNLGLPIRGRI